MPKQPTLDDWKATAYAAIHFPYRRALTGALTSVLQECLVAAGATRCLYLGFESPSVIDALQTSSLERLYTASEFDHWLREWDFWGDDESPTEARHDTRAFMGDKVYRVIEGDPRGIDMLVLDRDLDPDRLRYFADALRGERRSRGMDPKVLVLLDLQEPDGPLTAAQIAHESGWHGLRIADSYRHATHDLPAPETHVVQVWRPHGSPIEDLNKAALARQLRVTPLSARPRASRRP